MCIFQAVYSNIDHVMLVRHVQCQYMFCTELLLSPVATMSTSATAPAESSPVDTLAAMYPWHDRETVAANLPPIRSIALDAFYQLIGSEPPTSLHEQGETDGQPEGQKPRREKKDEEQTTKKPATFGSVTAFMSVVNGILDEFEVKSTSQLC